ncbi:drebrin-like protein isoform X2 [Takifugu flavidus]|uniref:Drebrin n=1 Tax=Takifugu flavidus TaxID=433684 RepID=A0A5C6N148_9TELE|nr:drebrin-like protein isoform X2 [Takifugu flavidus]TWW60031.1 Drebrin-like protein [Takifugu flavidus]
MNAGKVNLDTYNLSLLTAKEDILNPRSSTNWAIFTYDGFTNKLKLADSGAGGVDELAAKFHASKPQYGLCKVANTETGAPQIALISWVGQNVEDYRRTECASHVPAIKNFFKEAHMFMTAENVEDVTEEKIRAELCKAQAQAPSQWVRRSSRSAEKEELVGTNYRKTNAAMEMRRINRESFWARAEREEEERKEEERRRTAEQRRRLEKERILKERRDAEERDRKMDEKLRMIEEQRRREAEQEEALLRKEKLKWELEQREHEDDMRARLRRSESIEKAAEAAVLVSQRSINPREFFRQLSSSSSQSPTSPGSSRGGKPFRRYQRSLTDTAFIFSKAEEGRPPSPRSSPLASPFSRAPPSPIFRAASPPASPDFRPVTSPPRSRAPMSPLTSPLRPSPPVLAMPKVPQNNDPAQLDSEEKSPTEPSAPPASPTVLASLSSSVLIDSSARPHPEVLLASPSNPPAQSEECSFCFDPLVAPTAPLPERPNPAASQVHAELVSDIGYKVQAVLVEEDEEEDECEATVAGAQTQPGAATSGTVEAEAEEREPEGEKMEEQEEEEEAEEEPGEEEQQHEEEEETEGKNEEQLEKEKEDGEEVLKQDAEAALVEEEERMREDEEKNIQAAAQEPAEPAESAVTDIETASQEFQRPTVVMSTNGMTNGEEHNGIERSLSPSDAELSSPEPTARCDGRITAGEEDGDGGQEEISENGQEVLAEPEMCVRALYDYRAEDESEISFELGDIIRGVETVDKAWWRGRSKDGRQGLFPANYVEAI